MIRLILLTCSIANLNDKMGMEIQTKSGTNQHFSKPVRVNIMLWVHIACTYVHVLITTTSSRAYRVFAHWVYSMLVLMYGNQPEQNQVHGLLADVVEFLQKSLHGHSQLVHVGDFHVRLVVCLRINKIAIHQAPHVVLLHLACKSEGGSWQVYGSEPSHTGNMCVLVCNGICMYTGIHQSSVAESKYYIVTEHMYVHM